MFARGVLLPARYATKLACSSPSLYYSRFINMKAVRIHSTGGPEVLKYEEVDKPQAGSGQLVVKNEATGVNFIDTYHRSGLYKLPLPQTLGREGAGIVESVGEGVTNFKVGDKVALITYFAAGSYAEFTAVPAAKTFKLPDNVSSTEGASLMLQGLTAHYLVRSTFPVNSSHTILVHAGAGGLGQLVIQVAKHLGAKVITTVSTEQKAAIVKSLGADHEVKRITNNVGVDVVYDSVGKDTWEGSINSLKPLGYLVLCGNASGAVPPLDPLLLSEKGSLFVTRPTLEAFEARCKEVFHWVATKVVKVSEPSTFPLSQAAEAQEFLTSRKSTGKVVLIP